MNLITGSSLPPLDDNENAITLGLDSLDQIEICMAIEEEFDIELPDERLDAIQNFGQLITLVAELKK